MYKVGDRVYCKRNFINSINNRLFTMGYYYEIVSDNVPLSEFFIKKKA